MRQAFARCHEENIRPDLALEKRRENINRPFRLDQHFVQLRQPVFMTLNQRIQATMQAIERLIMRGQNKRIFR